MASPDELPTLLDRLNIKKFSHKDATAAIKGERIPDALGLPLLRLCTIRGIRYHDGFGLELRGVTDEFTRALNARTIMSNRVPETEGEQEIPYCIWHPEVATEETYRRVAQKYRSMRYQVARACAVAGYTELYNELDVLPEVHVAEEAREAGNMEIYDLIMAQPVKFKVMNDYDRNIASEPKEAYLNGDTAVRAILEVKQLFRDATSPAGEEEFSLFGEDDGYDATIFNITEDMNIDIRDMKVEVAASRNSTKHSELLIDLLTSPLPTHLPTVDKDLLISMAAYNGNIDRYVRLQRSRMIEGEVHCCVHGIYHNAMFAVWWSKQELPKDCSHHLKRAINARFIMNNVLSTVVANALDTELPYLIWYPSIAQASTYRKLAQIKPEMTPQIIRACIVGDHMDLFDELLKSDFQPDEALLEEAERSSHSHYKEALAAQVKATGSRELQVFEKWKLQDHRDLQRSENLVYKSITNAFPRTGFESLYNGLQCSVGGVELMACLPGAAEMFEDDEDDMKEIDYRTTPVQK